METNDYLIRHIEQIGILLGRLLGLKKDNKDEEIRQALSNAYVNLFGINFSETTEKNSNIFFDQMEFSKKNIEKVEALVDMLTFDACNATASQEDKRSKILLIKKILQRLNQTDKGVYSLKRTEIMNFIDNELNDHA